MILKIYTKIFILLIYENILISLLAHFIILLMPSNFYPTLLGIFSHTTMKLLFVDDDKNNNRRVVFLRKKMSSSIVKKSSPTKSSNVFTFHIFPECSYTYLLVCPPRAFYNFLRTSNMSVRKYKDEKLKDKYFSRVTFALLFPAHHKLDEEEVYSR